MSKFLSRKFLVAVVTGGLLIGNAFLTTYGKPEIPVEATVEAIVSIVGAIATAIGYIFAEAKVDASRK